MFFFFFFFFPLFPLSFICAAPGTEGLNLKEGVGPLGGEAWLVLASMRLFFKT